MKNFASFLAAFDRRLVQFMRVICLCCFTLLLLLLAGNVFVRLYAGIYDRVPSFIRIPIIGFYWFDEVVEWAFAWMVFFGAAALWARNEHFKLEWIAVKMEGTRIGHLIVAEEIRVNLKLAEVLFIPAGQPWLKAERPISSARHRVEMLELGIEGNSHLRLSTTEVDRTGPSYTVDTIDILQL